MSLPATREGHLYFVEVESRHGETWNAEEAIDAKKRTLKQGVFVYYLQFVKLVLKNSSSLSQGIIFFGSPCPCSSV